MPEIHDPIPTTTESAIRSVIHEVIDGSEAYLVELSMRGRSGSRVVNVYLDSDDGLGIGQLASISRQVAFLLESGEVIKGLYHLNVSSPGADRPLVLPRQYQKHKGRTLRITLSGEEEEARVVTGNLAVVDDERITLESADGESIDLPFDSIQEAVVQLPW